MIVGIVAGGSVGSVSPAYLDQLAVVPQSVLSIKKLISTATNAIRVRRSSDNAEQDIGFSGDALDTTDLASFVGANSAYVTTVYDQTGNGFDAVQPTSADQPRIVNAGVYDGLLKFNGTTHSLKLASATLGTPQVGIYSKIKNPTGPSFQIIVELSSGVNANPVQSFSAYRRPSDDDLQINSFNTPDTDIRSKKYTATNLTSLAQATILLDRSIVGTNELLYYVGGTLQVSNFDNTSEQTGNYASGDIYVGARLGTSLFAQMDLATLVFYNADSSGIRTDVEAMLA